MRQTPSYFDVIQSLLRPLQVPISLESLIDQVLAARPPVARDPRRAILNQIRQAQGHLLVQPDPGTVMPLRLAFLGVRFRIRLDRETVNSGRLEIETPLRSYLPLHFPLERLVLVEASGRPIPFDLVSVASKAETFFGLSELTHWHAKLSGWFRSQKAYHKDHLLFTLLDWEQGIFRLELEPALAHRFDLIKERNRQLADRFYDQLEQASRDMLFVHVAVPTAYARLQDKGGYPPDHWQVALEEDGRITSDEFGIHYSDGWISPLEAMLRQAAGGRLIAQPKKLSRSEAEQVYRLKAQLAYNPKIWRVIEIKGKQNLADLDSALRRAFDHDTFDHMGGFWKLVRRGSEKSKRFREVDLGDVDPFGEGEGADTPIASLGLQEGDRLKYVYDFGDWIEHVLTLEGIQASQAKMEYPREAGRNQPQYVNCAECQGKGKESRAVWICLTCSEEEQQDIVLCKRCANRHEEDHDLEEILY